MSKHLFAILVTSYGTAANNRGQTEGNLATLQKILWKGQVHTTVSAEAIRWAIRGYWDDHGEQVNRKWNPETFGHEWKDPAWEPWTGDSAAPRCGETFIDDDVMGFMLASAAKTDGSDERSDVEDENDDWPLDEQLAGGTTVRNMEAGPAASRRSRNAVRKWSRPSKGRADKRRGALEVTRAVSLSPFAGDLVFNAKSGAKSNTTIYGTECHATRYQYGIALTPESLRDRTRALKVVDALTGIRHVGGNHGRFLFDFSPDSVIFRWTSDCAPRLLYGFDMDEKGNVGIDALTQKVRDGDILASELYIGGAIVHSMDYSTRCLLLQRGARESERHGVLAAAEAVKRRMRNDLGIDQA